MLRFLGHGQALQDSFATVDTVDSLYLFPPVSASILKCVFLNIETKWSAWLQDHLAMSAMHFLTGVAQSTHHSLFKGPALEQVGEPYFACVEDGHRIYGP